MITGLRPRRSATRILLLSAAFVLACSVTASADPGTSTRPPTVGGALPSTGLTIHPTAGSVGSLVTFEGVCGARVLVASPAIAWGVGFSNDGRIETDSSMSPFSVFAFGSSFDSPTGYAAFHGVNPVPATLMTPAGSTPGTIPVTPGIYYFHSGCICSALASCPGTPPASRGTLSSVLLPPVAFCVVPCLGDGWARYLAERIGVGRFYAAGLVARYSGPSDSNFYLSALAATPTTTTAPPTTTEPPTPTTEPPPPETEPPVTVGTEPPNTAAPTTAPHNTAGTTSTTTSTTMKPPCTQKPCP